MNSVLDMRSLRLRSRDPVIDEGKSSTTRRKSGIWRQALEKSNVRAFGASPSRAVA
jgi:hypothetical protein